MNKKILEDYKKNIQYETRYYDNAHYYVGNVKLYHAFDFDADVIADKFKENRQDVKDWLSENEKSIDSIFWDYVNFRGQDFIDFAMFDKEEIKDLETDDKVCFVGRMAGWSGFEYCPSDIVEDYENDFIDNDTMKQETKRLKNMNYVIDLIVKESKSLSVNDEITEYINSNVIDDIIKEKENKKQFENITFTNREMINNTKEQYELIGLDVSFSLIIK